MREMDITDILRGKSSKDCQCCAYGACECACDVTWPEQVAVEAADEIDRLRAELAGKEKALSAAKTVIEAKDKSYALIDQRFAAMAAKAATTDSERECNERLTAEIDALTAELSEARRLLDEARKQEPLAWRNPHNGVVIEPRRKSQEGVGGGYPNFSQPLYASPVPAQPAVPDDVAKDAARYRWMRSDMKILWGDDVLAIIGESGASFDAAIDAAILSTTEGRKDESA